MLRSVEIILLCLLAWCPSCAASQAAAPCLDLPLRERPYSRVRLFDAVKNQSPARAEYLIRTCGVRVAFNAQLEADLRESGANDDLIAVVRDVAPAPVEKRDQGLALQTSGVNPTNSATRSTVNPRDGMRYVFIPPGTFRMGCSPVDADCKSNEEPVHDVRITRGFWMGQTDVTVGAYKRYVRSTGKAMPVWPSPLRNLNPDWGNESVPITLVSWADSDSFCTWAGLRLPTEAEWEYAARAGTTGARYGELDDIAWWGGNSGENPIDADGIWKSEQARFSMKLFQNGNRPRGVAQKQPNAFGLYDMIGNVWQWTSDWYKDSYEGARLQNDPRGPASGTTRVVRGGSFDHISTALRSSQRMGEDPSRQYDSFGFRCAGEIHIP